MDWAKMIDEMHYSHSDAMEWVPASEEQTDEGKQNED